MIHFPSRTTTYFFFNDTATTEIYTLSLHDALPIWWNGVSVPPQSNTTARRRGPPSEATADESTRVLQTRSRPYTDHHVRPGRRRGGRRGLRSRAERRRARGAPDPRDHDRRDVRGLLT